MTIYENAPDLNDEVEDISLGDKRLNQRAKSIFQKLLDKPNYSINSAMQGWAETKACYRLFCNPKVKPEKIYGPHQQNTQKRIHAHDTILCVQVLPR
ncbi:MAG: transposase [Rickettsiaceae bacterium]|nr:transposase [Rickettsiaceae bacterium]